MDNSRSGWFGSETVIVSENYLIDKFRPVIWLWEYADQADIQSNERYLLPLRSPERVDSSNELHFPKRGMYETWLKLVQLLGNPKYRGLKDYVIGQCKEYVLETHMQYFDKEVLETMWDMKDLADENNGLQVTFHVARPVLVSVQKSIMDTA